MTALKNVQPAGIPPWREATAGRPRRRRFTGVVSSAGKMTKTVRVAVERTAWHPKVGKQMRRTNVFLVHDGQGAVRVGDRVVIEQTRPLSKLKRFRVIRILSKAAGGSS